MPISIDSLPALFTHPAIYPQVYILFTLHCIVGIIAAIVAQRKGFNRERWLIWGLIGGTAALVAALTTKRNA